MRGVFGRKNTATPTQSVLPSHTAYHPQSKAGLIETLILSKSAVEQDDTKWFTGVSDFAGSIQIRDRKAAKETDVAEYLISLHMVGHYIGEVLNGGHGQYVENSKLHGRTAEWCRDGLVMINAVDYLALYDKLLELTKSPDQQRNFSEGAFGPTPEMEALDKVFYPLHFKTEPLSGFIKRYVLSQPWCLIVEDAEYEAAIDQVWGQAQLA